MASAAVSTIVSHNPPGPAVTTHCGVVYCSQTFEDFSINCTTCSQEFNLLSCNIFIKHIKECLSTGFPILTSLIDTVSNNSIEEVFTSSITCDIAESPDAHFDPLLPMKVEIEPPDFQEKLCKAADYLSDYNDEDDFSISNGARRKMLIEIIEEYKKHPLLWNVNLSKSATVAEKALHYYQIGKVVNAKFGTHFTDIEFRRQISRLRCSYRHALKEKEEHGSEAQLWYFNKMHFIIRTIDDLKVEVLHEEPPDYDDEYFAESQDNETFDYDEESESDNNEDSGESGEASTASIVLTLINEYKQYPCLWDYDLSNISSRSSRDSAFQSITKAINTKFNKDFSDSAIRHKIGQLRENYMRVLRNKEAYERDNPNATENLPISLHYFHQLSFIVSKHSDAQIASNPHSKELYEQPTNEDESHISVDSYQEIDANSHDGNKKPYKGSLRKNYELLTFIIEEYKKQKCLWSKKHYKNTHSVRRTAYANMAKAINDKFETEFTPDNMSTEICRLRSSYMRMVRKKRENPNYEATVWYADILSFIENNGDADNEVVQDSEADARSNDKSLAESDLSKKKKYQGRFQNQCDIESKKYAFAIIKLYKNSPILWDTNHRWYLVRNERRKAFEAIISTLREEHNYPLTSKQVRDRLEYMKKCYFRALNNEVTTKPFFYDQMSFLEPFAKTYTDHAPNVNMKTTLCEEFAFLTDNRPLMVKFIRTYKNLSCLWDQNDTRDLSAQSKAYNKIIRMLARKNVVLTKKQVLSAINFLHTTVASTQKAIERDIIRNETKAEIVWFYKYLSFLGRAPRVDDKYCSHCSTHFSTALEYENHKIELGDSPYRCTLCNKGCTTRNKFIYHMKTHKKPIKCDKCDFQAYDKQGFRIHMNRHLGITPYQCELCEKGFVTSSELTRHVFAHTGEKLVVCEICGKKFPTNGVLNNHMKRHLNQRDHKCKLCDNAFYTMDSLHNHMAGHTDERKHVCEICGASFNRKMTLRQHKTLHDEQKKHVCRICGKRFAQKAGLYSHMKSHNVLLKKS